MTPLFQARRGRVLVVDDLDANRRLIRRLLSPDIDVVEASDAAEAFGVLKDGEVDLVLLDVMMPGMDGFDACRAIKAAAGSTFLPVMLLTALADERSRQLGLEAGADDFLAKPFNVSEMRLRVGVFLRIRAQEQELRSQLGVMHDRDVLKDDLISLIVHDLRNPLTGIVGMLHVLREEVPEALLDDVDLALAGSLRLRDTIEDLLRVRQMEGGDLVLCRESVPLNALFHDVAKTLTGMALGLRVSVVCRGNVNADVDRKLMRRVLENLLANALKFSSANGVVELVASSTPSGTKIEVLDRGRGISDVAKATLFSRFDGNTAGDPRHGFGLGLYLVGLAVVAHGGSVTALDRDGGGTVICITIPKPTRPLPDVGFHRAST